MPDALYVICLSLCGVLSLCCVVVVVVVVVAVVVAMFMTCRLSSFQQLQHLWRRQWLRTTMLYVFLAAFSIEGLSRTLSIAVNSSL